MTDRCIVVDDEVLAREGLERFIKETPFLKHQASFKSAPPALHYLRQNPVDILFLDIQMPDMTGLEMMKLLTNPPQVIFTTAYREFALDGFELNVVDYLLKPFSYERFLKAAQKAVSINKDRKDHIFIKSDGMIIKIPLDEICYIETAKDYVLIYTSASRYMALIPMRQIEAYLPSSKFMRVHRSYMVGLQHVEKIEGNRLHVNEQKIPVSRHLRDVVYQRIIGNRLIEKN